MNDITGEIKMPDIVEKIGESLIQHGKFNNRIYLLKLDPGDTNTIIPDLEKLALNEGYTKIFCKIPSNESPVFILNGYHIEAFIPRFYNGFSDCILVSKFFDEDRKNPPTEELALFDELLRFSNEKTVGKDIDNYYRYLSVELNADDVVDITEVFKQVFETYPFPVHDSSYILETMEKGNARYFGIRDGKKLIGLSTAEIDQEGKNAEMTDFAVLPKYRGYNLAFRLLLTMEKEMALTGIKTCYTIARLKVPGMNKTFIKAGYSYGGTLVNNTNIGGSIESMNIFYKHL